MPPPHEGSMTGVSATHGSLTALSAQLGTQLRTAVETLLQSRTPVLDPVWHLHRPEHIHRAACRFMMRLVVVLFAESRSLLPDASSVDVRASSLGALIGRLDRSTPSQRRQHFHAWPCLLALFRLLHHRAGPEGQQIQTGGSDLFAAGHPEGNGIQQALAVLESPATPPDDEVLYQILWMLTHTRDWSAPGPGPQQV